MLNHGLSVKSSCVVRLLKRLIMFGKLAPKASGQRGVLRNWPDQRALCVSSRAQSSDKARWLFISRLLHGW